MAEVKEYRYSEILRAELVETDARINTINGVEWVKAGDYLVHVENGVQIVSAEYWERVTVPVTQEESDARRYSPRGKQVDDVVKFLKENPDEVERVKAEEAEGGKRKGILEFRS